MSRERPKKSTIRTKAEYLKSLREKGSFIMIRAYCSLSPNCCCQSATLAPLQHMAQERSVVMIHSFTDSYILVCQTNKTPACSSEGRLVFGLAGLTASAEPINRVIERAKWGTENPETLDRFAIPEDRQEITHSY